MRKIVLFLFALSTVTFLQAQYVGIGTVVPKAGLHVADSNVLFTGPVTLPANPNFNPPIQGAGSRLMWYPQKAALRSGFVTNTQWDKDSIGKHSFAAGYNVKAKGISSVAMGDSTSASGNYSTALGYFSVANAPVSTAMGIGTKASGIAATSIGSFSEASGDTSFAAGARTRATGQNSTALGTLTLAAGHHATAMGHSTNANGHMSFAQGISSNANGYYSRALGYVCNAIGDNSTAIGYFTNATGYNSIAIGTFATATNEYAMSIGRNSTANGINSLALGFSAKANGFASTAIGTGTISNANYCMVVGEYNDTTSTTSLFEIGNGTNNINRKNAMTVLANGNVGLGKIPAVRFDIFIGPTGSTYHPQTSLGVESDNSHYINLLTNTNSETGILFGNNFSGADGGITYRAVTAAVDPQALYFRSMGFTRMIMKKMGEVWIQGVLTQSSDARLKTNISRIQNPMASILALNGYNYNWIDPTLDNTLQTGLLAQELQAVYPQLVRENEKGELSIIYSGLIPILIEGMKEQQAQIDQLKQMITSLKAGFQEMQSLKKN